MLRGNHGRGMLKELNMRQRSNDHHVILSNNHLANLTSAGKPGEHEFTSWALSMGYVRHSNNNASNDQGTGSYVQIQNTPPPVTKGEYESGIHGEPIFAPKFVTLAHELGHARHNLRGKTKQSSWDRLDVQNPLLGHEDEQGKWTNPEEYENITREENPIRLEHNLPQRKYHATIDSGRATGNKINMNAQLDRMNDLVPQYLRAYMGPTYFGPFVTRIHKTDLANVQLAHQLQTDLDSLENSLQRKIAFAKMRYYATYLKPTWKKLLIGGSLLALSATAGYMLLGNKGDNK
jgi:hypothetical protein